MSHIQHHTGRSPFAPAAQDLIRVGSRRWFLQTGLAGVGGLTLPTLLQAKAAQAASSKPKSVILFWLSGGLSHIDSWDPKPDAPVEVRGPFGSMTTNVPGIRISDQLPLQAKIMDKLTLIRSVDATASNHTPITLQAGNPLARRGGDETTWPSMGSVVSKFHGPNDPQMPPFIGLTAPGQWKADVYGAGKMGVPYNPVSGEELKGRLTLPKGVTADRLSERSTLRAGFDRLRNDLDLTGTMIGMDESTSQAVDLVLSGKAQKAFNVEAETAKLRDAYGRDSLGEKALLARRLVEAGVTFTLVSGAWGYFDHHGDNVRWGGIVKGLKPLLPRLDQVIYTLVNDLEDRGLLDDTLILVFTEFGRGPVINKEAGRDHWVNCMSILMAGGGLRHGQVIGATDSRGYDIKERRVRPQDLAATTFRYFGIDTNATWMGADGRPMPIVVEGGQPIMELF